MMRWYDATRPYRLRALQRHSGYYDRRRRRERPASRTEPPTIEEIANHENLLRMFQQLKREGGPAPGPDGVTYNDLSRSEAATIMRDLSREIREDRYRPSRSRRIRRPKPSGGHRVLSLRSIVSRVVGGAINDALAPLWETIFLDGSHGFRTGRGNWTFLLALEDQIMEHGRVVVAQDDIRNAFDNLNVGVLMEDHRQHISDSQLLGLIEAVLRGNETAPRTVGIDQGCPYSPTALNLHLHRHLDMPFDRDGANPSWLRYADNLVYACQDVSEGHRALNQSTQLLQDVGLSPKGEAGPPVDLLNGGTTVIMGLDVSWRDGRLRYGLTEGAWEGLDEGLGKAHGTANPPETALQVVRGWAESQGPALESGTDEIVEPVLNRAAQAGFREISRETVRRLAQAARDRWRSHRERHREYVGTGGQVSAAPPAGDATGRRDARGPARTDVRSGEPASFTDSCASAP